MKFKSYEKFLEWVYEPSTRDQRYQVWPRLKEESEIIIDDEETYYNSVMECLHAHEEG